MSLNKEKLIEKIKRIQPSIEINNYKRTDISYIVNDYLLDDELLIDIFNYINDNLNNISFIELRKISDSLICRQTLPKDIIKEIVSEEWFFKYLHDVNYSLIKFQILDTELLELISENLKNLELMTYYQKLDEKFIIKHLNNFDINKLIINQLDLSNDFIKTLSKYFLDREKDLLSKFQKNYRIENNFDILKFKNSYTIEERKEFFKKYIPDNCLDSGIIGTVYFVKESDYFYYRYWNFRSKIVHNNLVLKNSNTWYSFKINFNTIPKDIVKLGKKKEGEILCFLVKVRYEDLYIKDEDDNFSRPSLIINGDDYKFFSNNIELIAPFGAKGKIFNLKES